MRIGAQLATAAALLLVIPPAAAAPRTHVIVIDKMKFGPAPAALRSGDTILWVNRDIFQHTATASTKAFDVDLPPGKSARTTIRSKGPIKVICKYHPGMRTVLKVDP